MTPILQGGKRHKEAQKEVEGARPAKAARRERSPSPASEEEDLLPPPPTWGARRAARTSLGSQEASRPPIPPQVLVSGHVFKWKAVLSLFAAGQSCRW